MNSEPKNDFMKFEHSRSILDNSDTTMTHMALREENSAWDFTVYNEANPHIEYDNTSVPCTDDLDLDV